VIGEENGREQESEATEMGAVDVREKRGELRGIMRECASAGRVS